MFLSESPCNCFTQGSLTSRGTSEGRSGTMVCPCFLRKAQTVARGTGDRIANAARGQHSAVAGDHPLALRVAHAHARYAAFLNHQPQRFYLAA